MAKVSHADGSKYRGKVNKKTNEVHRVRNGEEHTYTLTPYAGPASKAQKAHRSLHGKVCSILNPMMADRARVKELDKQRVEHNRLHGTKFITVRQFAYHLISEQLKQQAPAKPVKATVRTPLPRGVTMYAKPFADLSAAELYEILKARFAVFTLEQGIRYLDEDDTDYTATHLVFRRKGKVVAYARLYKKDEEQDVLRAGRMLTVERGKGLGRLLVMHAIAEARRQGASVLRLHAQQQAVPFYRHFRFRTVGDTFLEADIPHITMERKL